MFFILKYLFSLDFSSPLSSLLRLLKHTSHHGFWALCSNAANDTLLSCSFSSFCSSCLEGNSTLILNHDVLCIFKSSASSMHGQLWESIKQISLLTEKRSTAIKFLSAFSCFMSCSLVEAVTFKQQLGRQKKHTCLSV